MLVLAADFSKHRILCRAGEPRLQRSAGNRFAVVSSGLRRGDFYDSYEVRL
jgi:hypothetical protein